MLIILAARQDKTAWWLADRWEGHEAVVVSATDLSTSGWNLDFPSNGRSISNIARRKVMNQEIDGVLTRMARVYSHELDHIVPTDRQYVASEMTAFLLAWLSSLKCPILNPPTPDCLCGPGWRTEEWVQFAGRLGMSVSTVRRKSSGGGENSEIQSLCEVTVIGDKCFGSAAPRLIENAHTLAKAAGTSFLAVRFTGSEADAAFVNASPWPRLDSPEVADATLCCLRGRLAC